MTIEAIDTADPINFTKKLSQFKSQGGKDAIYYINPLWIANAKTAKKPTIDATHLAGINAGFVCEGWGGSNNFSHHDINAITGTRDGATCGNWLNQLGAPDSVAVYAAIDNDVSAQQLNAFCLPYFKSFRAALPAKYKLGAYGCGALLAALQVDFYWLSNATGWSGYKTFKASNKWHILQGLPTKSIGGIDVDPDQLNPAFKDYGFWNAPTGIMDINSNVAH